MLTENPKSYGPVLQIPNIIGSFIAPARAVLEDWMEDYRQDPEVFTYFFNQPHVISMTTSVSTSSMAGCVLTTKLLSRRTAPRKSSQAITTPSSLVTGGYTGPSA